VRIAVPAQGQLERGIRGNPTVWMRRNWTVGPKIDQPSPKQAAGKIACDAHGKRKAIRLAQAGDGAAFDFLYHLS